MTRITLPRRLLALVLLLATLPVHALLETVDLRNQARMSYGFLFADDGLEFVDLEFKNDFRDWTLLEFTPTLAVYAGSPVAAERGRVRLAFAHGGAGGSLQFAEALFDGVDYALVAQGTATFSADPHGRDVWGSASVFAPEHAAFVAAYLTVPSPVPLPSPLVLLTAASVFLLCLRRRGLLAL